MLFINYCEAIEKRKYAAPIIESHLFLYFKNLYNRSPKPTKQKPTMVKVYNPRQCSCCKKETMGQLLNFNLRNPPVNRREIAKQHRVLEQQKYFYTNYPYLILISIIYDKTRK